MYIIYSLTACNGSAMAEKQCVYVYVHVHKMVCSCVVTVFVCNRFSCFLFLMMRKISTVRYKHISILVKIGNTGKLFCALYYKK